MNSKTFAVKNDNQDICDCLVKIAEKNGYTFNEISVITEDKRKWLICYPISPQQDEKIVKYFTNPMGYPQLSFIIVDDFAEIVKRLEEPSAKEEQHKGGEAMNDFYIKVETPEIAYCLVRIAQKNGYILDENDENNVYLYFYPVTHRTQFLDGIADFSRELLHETNDFAEIIRRLEEPSAKKARLDSENKTKRITLTQYESRLRVEIDPDVIVAITSLVPKHGHPHRTRIDTSVNRNYLWWVVYESLEEINAAIKNTSE